MAALKHTPLRHMVLAMAERDTFERYCATSLRTFPEVWKFRQVGSVLGGPEARGLGELWKAHLLREVPTTRYHAPRPVLRTHTGDALLSEWNAKYGDPLANPGAPQARSIPDTPEETG